MKKSKSQIILEAIRKSGEVGMRNADLMKLADTTRHVLNVYIWKMRGDGDVITVTVRRHAIHLAAGVSTEKAKATLEAEEAQRHEARRQKHNQKLKEWRIKQAEKKGPAKSKLSEAQLAQKRAASAKARARALELKKNPELRLQQAKVLDQGAKRPRRAKFGAQMNKLAAQILREKPSMLTESAKPAQVIDWSRAKVTKIASKPGRFEVLEAEPVFTGKPLLPASSCMARALG
jgi:hypothetical protein